MSLLVTEPGVLVFPGGLTESRAFAIQCQQSGRRVIGGSSVRDDPSSTAYHDWIYLPFAHEATFESALISAIAEYRIAEIFSPHPVAWKIISQIIRTRCLNYVRLLGEDPSSSLNRLYDLSFAQANGFPDVMHLAALSEDPAPRTLSKLQLASLFYFAERVPGMCSVDKQFALSQIAPFVPKGDLVEIGSWWGKSAFVIAFLAKHFNLGNLLCVDPWSSAYLDQFDGDAAIDALGRDLDCEQAFRVFSVNMAGFPTGRINYLRRPSSEALAQYIAMLPGFIESPQFGRTHFAGKIALLHIDGNHSYKAARDDIEGWTPLLCPSGWLIVDDYLWTYGDGPRKAADEFLLARAADYECAFVYAGTLFARRAASTVCVT